MKLLVLGGTKFLGRHVADEALRRGWDLTLFNRGRTNPGLYEGEVEQLRGDRASDVSALRGRAFDAVVDTSGYVPRHVRQTIEALDGCGHYTFVSSLSVYGWVKTPGLDESAPTEHLTEPTEEVTEQSYGPLKVLCEEAAEELLPGRVFSVRAGLIVGPHDPTDRFIYWPHRIARGGRVLAPGSPDEPLQFIDGRDLAGWMLDMAEQGGTGVYNATGPERELSMGEFLETCVGVTRSGAELVWVERKFLLERSIAPWTQLPLVMPEAGDPAGFLISNAKAVAAGLTFRPLEQTVRDALDWEASRGERTLTLGLDPDLEAELLADWERSRG